MSEVPQPDLPTGPTPSADDLSRWRLVVRLAETLVESVDVTACVDVVARLLAQEFGDAAVVTVLAPPEQDDPAVGIAHRDPARAELVRGLVRTWNRDDWRAFAEAVGQASDPVTTVLPASPETGRFVAAYAEYQATTGVASSAFAALRRADGGTVGVVVCNRDGGSAPYSDSDMSAIAAAANMISLMLSAVAARAAEIAVRRQRAIVFATAPIGVAAIDPSGLVLRVNEVACEILGLQPADIVGHWWQQYGERYGVSPADIAEDRADFEALLGGGRAPGFRTRQIHRPDGTVRWVRLWQVLIPDARGRPEVVHAQFVDVTEFFDANARAEQFASLVHSSPDFIAIAGLDGRVQFVNEAGRQLIGMPADIDVEQTSITDYLSPQGQAASVGFEQPAVVRDGSWDGLGSVRDWRDDGEIPVAISSFLLHDPRSGAPTALATVQRDIRDQLAAEAAIGELAEQRRLLLAELVTAEQAERTRIAADVHDESLQLLAAGQLRLQLLAHHLEADPDAARKDIADVTALVASALQRLRELLVDLEPSTVHDNSLADALDHAAHQFFDGTATTVRIVGAFDDLPDEMAAVLHRAGREALSNARRHAHATAVTVTLRTEPTAWVLTVDDDGVGVPDTIAARAGHLGIRGMTSRVAALGGECAVLPRPDGGTRVYIALPRVAE